ncbi:MAG: hypothetical protein Q8P90_00765 [bacterium]|nr:hypothetical protein [bacterium]
MENFILGIQANARELSLMLKYFARFELFWGFAIGFFVSTIAHGFIISDNPKHIPTILFSDNAVSFEKLYKKDKEGSYLSSYSTFVKIVDKVKFIFSLSIFLFVFIVFISLIRY